MKKLWRLSQIISMFVLVSSFQFPPISPDGSALFTYGNQSGLDDENIFIQVVGVNPTTGNQCFIEYDHHGNPSYFDVLQNTHSQHYSYSLAHFPNSQTGDGKMLYLPMLNGARLYTSINEKIVFLVSQNDLGEWTISAPNPLNPTDPNRDILWDKTEFAVNPFAIFINPTAVDDFALPLYCEETGKNGSKQSSGITVSRKKVFEDVKKAFHSAGAPWPALIPTAPARIYAPIFGAATGVIPRDILVKSGWIDGFKAVYSSSPLLIDAEESLPIDQGGGIWQGTINAETSVITFTRIVDEKHPAIPPATISLPLNIDELLSGTGPSWQIQPGNQLQLIFARDISCAIDTNTLSTTEALNQVYFREQADQFYQHNSKMPDTLQFIDYYSKTLHSYGNHQIYTIPYDDELGQSGAASYVPENYAGGKIVLGPLY